MATQYFTIKPMDNEKIYGYMILLENGRESKFSGHITPYVSSDGEEWRIFIGAARFEFELREMESAISAIEWVKSHEKLFIDNVFSDPNVFLPINTKNTRVEK